MKGAVNVTAKDLDTNGRRKLQPWQAYLRLFRDAKVIPEVGLRMKEYAHLTDKERAKKKFNIQNEVARELYKTASDDEKAAVEQYREKHANFEEGDDDITSRNRRFNE